VKPTAKGPSPGLRLQIRSVLEEAEAAARVIRVFLEGRGLASNAFKTELLARECLNNAIIHGNRNHARKPVMLEINVGTRWLRLCVTDAGNGFNWRRVTRSVPKGTDCCGRGLAIVAAYANRVSFNRRGNRISLWLDNGKS
jgi:serine/threonine-protein kinase RsbW